MASEWEVRALDQDTWPSFTELVEHCDGFPSGCWCMAFHAEGQATEGDYAAVNRARKLARVAAGTAHAALVFDGSSCIGWCQFGPTDELPRIKGRAAYERSCTTFARLANRLLLRGEGSSSTGCRPRCHRGRPQADR